MEALARRVETAREIGIGVADRRNRYLHDDAQLRSLIDVVELIRPLPEDIAPSPQFRQRTRRRILWRES
jgi:hypothetical protein